MLLFANEDAVDALTDGLENRPDCEDVGSAEGENKLGAGFVGECPLTAGRLLSDDSSRPFLPTRFPNIFEVCELAEVEGRAGYVI